MKTRSESARMIVALGALCMAAFLAPNRLEEPRGREANELAPPAHLDTWSEDAKSLDGLLAALYASISGPEGKPRDFERFHALFHPEARLLPLRGDARDAKETLALSPKAYAERFGPSLVAAGFEERELKRRVERFGPLIQVWSSYRATLSANPQAPPIEGVNGIQVLHDGARYWILNIAWAAATDERPLPADLRGS